MTGPLYRHHPGRLNPSRAAPHLDGLWFLADFPSGWVDTARLDSTGMRSWPRAGCVISPTTVRWIRPQPQSAILRLVWRGCPVPVSGIPSAAPRPGDYIAGSTLHVTGGPHSVRLRDSAGRLVRIYSAGAGAAHPLESVGLPGV